MEKELKEKKEGAQMFADLQSLNPNVLSRTYRDAEGLFIIKDLREDIWEAREMYGKKQFSELKNLAEKGGWKVKKETYQEYRKERNWWIIEDILEDIKYLVNLEIIQLKKQLDKISNLF